VFVCSSWKCETLIEYAAVLCDFRRVNGVNGLNGVNGVNRVNGVDLHPKGETQN
jgi:hypothetical protein